MTSQTEIRDVLVDVAVERRDADAHVDVMEDNKNANQEMTVSKPTLRNSGEMRRIVVTLVIVVKEVSVVRSRTVALRIRNAVLRIRNAVLRRRNAVLRRRRPANVNALLKEIVDALPRIKVPAKTRPELVLLKPTVDVS